MRYDVRFGAVLWSVLALVGCTAEVGEGDVEATQGAITHGELDGNAHPGVVLIVMDVDGEPAYRCSGTLLDARHVLTAGHCTGEPGEFTGMRIFTESDVDNGDNDFPYGGNNSVEASRWFTHPEYTSEAFFLHDVGVIELSRSVRLSSAAYGKLPRANALDGLKPSVETSFTAVGYGLQQVNSAFYQGDRVRMVAHPYLVQVNTGFTGPGSLLLSNNASTGGTCFGDSGGPNFLGTGMTVAGVTSFGLNGSCGGTGGVFRLDRSDVLEFIASALGSRR